MASSLAVCVLVIAVSSACGRYGFDDVADAMSDTSEDGITVYADFSADYSFVVDDLVDGTSTYAKEPRVLCALESPFRGAIGVVVGRTLLEITAGAATITHDFHPGVNDSNGPDQISSCLFATTPSTGPVVWLSAASINTGDGLYYLEPAGNLVLANNQNNSHALLFDAAGTHTQGIPDLLYGASNSLFRRPDGVQITNTGFRVLDLALTADGSYATVVTTDSFNEFTLGKFTAGTLVFAALDQFPTRVTLAIESAPPAPLMAYGIVAQRELVAFHADGTFSILASSAEPESRWVAVSAPRDGHPLAGAIYVIESNRSIGRDRILRIPKP